jgi:hypothetical protein
MDMYWILINFSHLVGIIIMVGSVSVIDMFGFVAKNSKKWTKNTIEAHYITKPMIWFGAILVTLTWILILFRVEFDIIAKLKTWIIPFLILNGIFLSFHISPILSKQRGKEKLLPNSLKNKIALSFIISLILNWSFVFLTILGYLK